MTTKQPPQPYSVDYQLKCQFSANDAEELGRKVQDSPYLVYLLECELLPRQMTQYDKKSEFAKRMLGEVPSWLYPAYKSDTVLYIGSTRDLSRRLKAHMVGSWNEDDGADKPSQLTAISAIRRLRIIATAESREKVESIEESVADAREDNNGVFVYQA